MRTLFFFGLRLVSLIYGFALFNALHPPLRFIPFMIMGTFPLMSTLST